MFSEITFLLDPDFNGIYDLLYDYLLDYLLDYWFRKILDQPICGRHIFFCKGPERTITFKSKL
jgi:hypothetical protein